MRIKKRVLRTFGIRTDEAARVLWLGLHSLFIGVFAAFFFPIANALFLARFEITVLPVAYIVGGLFGWVTVMLFSRLERWLSLPRLLVINLLVLLVSNGALWLATVLTASKWAIFVMFVWVGPAYILLFLGYWGLAVRLFDLRQGKRLFGLVGAGEEIATVLGLFSIPLLVRLMAGPINLLLLSMIGLVGCLFVVVITCRQFGEALETDKDKDRKEPGGKGKGESGAPTKKRSGLLALLGSSYFLLMAALIIMLSLMHYVVDFGFLAQVRIKFQGSEQIAQFIGIFFGAAKLLELIMKLFFSGRLLSFFGLRVGLLILPILLVICAGLAVVVGTLGLPAAHFFILVALTKLVWVVARTSTFLPSFRVLYQPVPKADRLSYQTHVDGTAKQLATLLVGVALLVFSSGGGFNALHLFYGMIPMLGVWIAVVVWLYRQYRARLMENLTAEIGRTAASSPTEALMERLVRAPANLIEGAAAVMARVNATAVVPLLTGIVQRGSEQAKLAALRYLNLLKAVGAIEAVQQCTTEETSTEVRSEAEHTLQGLQEVLALAGDAERVTELAASPLPANRNLAVSAAGFSSDPHCHACLTELLWDKDRDVCRASLVAAGRVGSPAYWHRIVTQLFAPRFSNAATFALITIGDPVLVEMDRTFSRAEPNMQARILQIYERIGSPKAQELLLAKLDFPDLNVRRKALLSLHHGGFQAAGDQIRMVENEIEKVVRRLAWNMAAVLDIGDDEAVAPLRTALLDEITQGRYSLFLLLSLLYDSRAIDLVKSNLESPSPEAGIYALEILEILISPELKPLVFPVVEPLNHAQVLRRLDALVPRQRLDRLDRLSAITNRPFDAIGLWTRLCAIKAIARVAAEIVPDLPASLHHPNPLIREVAAHSIHELDAEACDRLLRKVPEEVRQRIELALPRDDDAEGWQRLSPFNRVDLLRSVDAFTKLPSDALITLAMSAEERLLKAGRRLPSPKEPKDAVYIVLDGQLARTGEQEPAGEDGLLPLLSLVAFGPGASPVEAVSVCRLIRLDPTQLNELAIEHHELIPALFEAVRQLFGEEEGPEPTEELLPDERELGI